MNQEQYFELSERFHSAMHALEVASENFADARFRVSQAMSLGIDTTTALNEMKHKQEIQRQAHFALMNLFIEMRDLKRQETK